MSTMDDDTSEEDSEPTEQPQTDPTFTVEVPIDLEAREVMYEELCQEFGEPNIQQTIEAVIIETANQAARKQVGRLYDNREQLRSQQAQQ